MIRLSAFADEMSGSVKEQLKFLNKEGIQFIELRFIDGRNIITLPQNSQKEVRDLLQQSGVGCSAIGSPIGKVPIGFEWQTHFDLFKKAVDSAILFDTKLIRIFSFYPEPNMSGSQYKDQVVTCLLQMVEYIHDTGLILAHENENGIFGNTATRCQFLAKEINSPNFKLVYDPGNFVWGQSIEKPMNTCWPLMKDFVNHIHIKDWELGANTGALPGEGNGQIASLLGELKLMDYQGCITMEPHLEIGGQFGGCTGEILYSNAIEAVRSLAKENNIDLQ